MEIEHKQAQVEVEEFYSTWVIDTLFELHNELLAQEMNDAESN
jgi:hypothetical protein